MKKFVETKEKGQLYVDKILFESNIPILFVCNNKEEELFLCICCQSNNKGRKWLISSVDEEIIISLLSDRISIRDALLKDDSLRLSAESRNDGIIIRYNADDWQNDSIYLPKAGAFIEAEEGEFKEEIDYYSRKIIGRIYRDSFDSILNESEQLSSLDLNSISLENNVVPDYENHYIEGEVKETIKSAKLQIAISSYLSSAPMGHDDEFRQTSEFCISNEPLTQVNMIAKTSFLCAA